MNILLNGKAHSVADGSSIADLIIEMNLTGNRYAVEVNEQLIPRSQHAAFTLNPDDVVEIVQAIGGG